jgi:hypothetical protein
MRIGVDGVSLDTESPAQKIDRGRSVLGASAGNERLADRYSAISFIVGFAL